MKDLSHPNLQKQCMNASVRRLYCIQLFFFYLLTLRMNSCHLIRAFTPPDSTLSESPTGSLKWYAEEKMK